MSSVASNKFVPAFALRMVTKLNWINSSIIRYDHIRNASNLLSALPSAISPIRNENHAKNAATIAIFPSQISNYQQQLVLCMQPNLSSTTVTSTSIRLYSTTPVSLAVGRRRRQQISGGLGGNDDESMTKTDPVVSNKNTTSGNVKIEPKVFASLATLLFDTIHQAMMPLVPINEVMILSRGESSRVMHEEQERQEHEERKRAKKEMKEQNKETSSRTGNMGNKNTIDNDDDDAEPISVQSMGDHRVVDGPYLKIELGPIHGQYTFIADVELNTILFQSPISGQLIYFYDLNNTNEWINVHDQHNLIGMFVRDIIRQIQGVPKI